MKLKRKFKDLVKFCINIWYTEWTDNEWKNCFKICFITNIIIGLSSAFFSLSDYLVNDSDITYITEAISGIYSGENLENTIYPLYDKYEENFSVEILSKNEIDVEYNSTIIHYIYTGSELKMNIDICLIITIVLIYLFIILVWCVIWVYICIIFSWLWRNKISGYINKFIRNIKKDDNENERQDNIDDEKSSEPKVIDIKDLYDNKK